MNSIKELNVVASIRRFINWKSLKTKIKDGLTMFPTQQLMLETYVIRADGTICKHRKGKAHSYTIGWLQHIEMVINHSYNVLNQLSVNIKDTNGTVRSFYYASNVYNQLIFGVVAPSTTTTYGILAGTGSTTVRADDYTIQTLIANGSASGQLNYSGTAVMGAAASSTTCSMSISRAIGNASGADITVNEIGVAVTTQDTGSTQRYVLVIHDNVTQTLHNGDVYLIIYTLTTSISS